MKRSTCERPDERTGGEEAVPLSDKIDIMFSDIRYKMDRSDVDPTDYLTKIHTQEEITAFWDDNHEGYSASMDSILASHDELVGLILHFVGKSKNLRVLDVGTGSGLMAILLKEMGHEVTALDVSSKMLEDARRNFQSRGLDIPTVQADGCRTGLKEASFDLVVLRNVIFTMPDAGKGYSEWIRLLVPGGNILVIDGNYYFQNSLEEYKKRKEYMEMKYGIDEVEFSREMGDIDYDRLKDIALNLHPNRVRRPSWDLWYLMYSGMEDIQVRNIDTEDYWMFTRLGYVKIPVRYALFATKALNRMKPEESEGPANRPSDLYDGSVDVLSAIGNEYRSRMVLSMMDGDMNNQQLCELTGLKSNLVSYHLKILKEAGIITSKKEGHNTYYSVADREMMEALLNAATKISRPHQEPT